LSFENELGDKWNGRIGPTRVVFWGGTIFLDDMWGIQKKYASKIAGKWGGKKREHDWIPEPLDLDKRKKKKKKKKKKNPTQPAHKKRREKREKRGKKGENRTDAPSILVTKQPQGETR